MLIFPRSILISGTGCQKGVSKVCGKSSTPLPLITPALFSHRPPPDREKRENSKEPFRLHPGIAALAPKGRQQLLGKKAAGAAGEIADQVAAPSALRPRGYSLRLVVTSRRRPHKGTTGVRKRDTPLIQSSSTVWGPL